MAIWQIPDAVGNDTSLYLPPAGANSSSKHHPFSQCQMYKEPGDPDAGLNACVHGYEFHVEDGEWNIVAEVRN